MQKSKDVKNAFLWYLLMLTILGIIMWLDDGFNGLTYFAMLLPVLLIIFSILADALSLA